MRNRILKILRALERQEGFKSKYRHAVEDDGRDLGYMVEEYFDFPTYRFLVEKFNDEYLSQPKGGLVVQSAANGIKAELRRMELDGLVMIGEQKGVRHAYGETSESPDYENMETNSDSIILTTKGKSEWRYFLHKATENPVTTMLSLLAILISLISLFK